jgi:ABC-type glycerol-3-phosphate transport system substrate-binding protein
MTLFKASMFHSFRRFLVVVGPGLLGLLVACTNAPTSPTPNTPTPTVTATAAASQSLPLPPTPGPDTPITLTLWLPTRFTPRDDNTAYRVLKRQLDEFAQSADGTSSQIVIKQDRGPGGLLDLLRAAHPVAKGILPDIIALDAADLETAARANLLQPIDRLLPDNWRDDFFPFARDLGTINGELYGAIYGADLEHLAANSAAPLPSNWEELLASPRRYLFPIGTSNNNVSDAVLAHYLSAGGILTDAQGQPTLDPIALRAILELYRQARDGSALPANVLELNSNDAVWNTWRGSSTSVVNLNASQFLSVEARLGQPQFGPLPANVKPARPIGRGWAFAIVTSDPRRQETAARLLQYLLSAQNNGEWTQAVGVLPGRQGSFSAWDQSKTYTTFIYDQLRQAQAAPSATLLSIIGPALEKAVEDVLSGRATPAEAAQAAAATVNSSKK